MLQSLKKGHCQQELGIYFPNKFSFKRICEYPAITDEKYPYLKNGTLIGYEFNIFPWHETRNADYYINESLRASEELAGLKPDKWRFHHYKEVYPIRNKENLKEFSNLEKEMKNIKNLKLSGRYGKFKYVNMNNCIELSFELISEITGMKIEDITYACDLC